MVASGCYGIAVFSCNTVCHNAIVLWVDAMVLLCYYLGFLNGCYGVAL